MITIHNQQHNIQQHNIQQNNIQQVFQECTCSAKVLQAFALFEMKQGNVKKAYALIQMAVKLDHELEPVLSWKQFRDAKEIVMNEK